MPINQIHTRILGKIGRRSSGSYHITLPLEEIKALKWRVGEMLFVKRDGNELRISKADYSPSSPERSSGLSSDK